MFCEDLFALENQLTYFTHHETYGADIVYQNHIITDFEIVSNKIKIDFFDKSTSLGHHLKKRKKETFYHAGLRIDALSSLQRENIIKYLTLIIPAIRSVYEKTITLFEVHIAYAAGFDLAPVGSDLSRFRDEYMSVLYKIDGAELTQFPTHYTVTWDYWWNNKDKFTTIIDDCTFVIDRNDVEYKINMLTAEVNKTYKKGYKFTYPSTIGKDIL